MGTKLYVKSERSFVVDKKEIIEGGRLGSNGQFDGYILPDTYVEVNDACAKKLKAMYPDEFMDLEALSRRTPREKAKAAAPASTGSFESGDR